MISPTPAAIACTVSSMRSNGTFASPTVSAPSLSDDLLY